MSKVIAFCHTTLDGYACGPQGELRWANVSDDIHADVTEQLKRVSGVIYGRITYEMMAGYWPSVFEEEKPSERDLKHARWVQQIPKLVISRSLEKADWENTTLVHDHIPEALGQQKASAGGDLMIFGSPRLVHLLAGQDLVDEYLIFQNPVTLGAGVPLMPPGKEMKLNLQGSKAFPQEGVVRLQYGVEKARS